MTNMALELELELLVVGLLSLAIWFWNRPFSLSKYRSAASSPRFQKPNYHSSAHVSEIWIYPVKSCRGIGIGEANVTETGLQYDRQYTFATRDYGSKDPLWYCATQRQYPRLALVHTNIIEGIKYGYIRMTFNRDLLGSKVMVELPLVEKDFQSEISEFPVENVYIWKETPEALNVTSLISAVHDDIRSFLHIPKSRELGLFRIIPGRPREVFRNAPRKEELGYQPLVGFADSYPIHLMSTSSYEDVKEKLLEPSLELTMSRFRANVVVTDLLPFDEDDWKDVAIGDFTYHVATRAVRCTLPNVDQETGLRHKSEPDRTMNAYRRIDEGAPGHACLGIHLVPTKNLGKIRVNDPIEVLRRGKHRYLPL